VNKNTQMVKSVLGNSVSKNEMLEVRNQAQ